MSLNSMRPLHTNLEDLGWMLSNDCQNLDELDEIVVFLNYNFK